MRVLCTSTLYIDLPDQVYTELQISQSQGEWIGRHRMEGETGEGGRAAG